MMSFILYGVLNTLFIVLISPLFMSLIKKVKAYSQGRRGPPLLQSYYTLLKLLKKERVYSETSSSITRVTPYLSIAVMLIACLFVPVVFIPEHPVGMGNVILFLYLLALAKFFTALSGLDAGSTFGGMGSSREMSISAIVEPITIMAFAALAFTLGTTNLFDMFEVTSFATDPVLILAIVPLIIALITETSRIPVDNPETHLELTMVHEAMILEYSGSDLALIELSHAIKQTLLVAVVVNLLVPWGLSAEVSLIAIAVSMLLFFMKAAIFSVCIGIFESSIAKMRLFNLPNFFAIGFLFSILTIMLKVFK